MHATASIAGCGYMLLRGILQTDLACGCEKEIREFIEDHLDERI